MSTGHVVNTYVSSNVINVDLYEKPEATVYQSMTPTEEAGEATGTREGQRFRPQLSVSF